VNVTIARQRIREHDVSRFHLGRRQRGGEAMAVIEVDAPVAAATLKELRTLEPVISARQIEL
jgi:hypothetical protein